MSVVYGSYFSTSGGKNFVRPVIDYTVSYTATTVSVTYKAGINVKSGWHTNAKFTSTFSATGQASKTREDNNKKWQAGNHFIFGPTTIKYSKTTSAQTKTLKMYSKTSVDSSSKSVSISIPALGLPTISDATAGRVQGTPTSVTVSFKASSSNNSAITAKINGEVVTAANGVYSKTFTNVSSDQHNYTITATDSVGTSTRTLTVPKLALPQVDVICTRDETDATKVVFNITANSFYKDNISSISIVVGSSSATVTGGEIDDSNALTVTKELTGLAETALTATVSVTGYGGTATLNVTVPSAFRTFDVGGEGKTIAFGMTARDEDVANGITIPENGLFECGMDAEFKGAVNINGGELVLGNLMNYISAQAQSGTSLTNSYKQITLAEVLKNGSLFEISGGGVKCLASGTVEAHATVYLTSGYTANDLVNAQVYKNGTGIGYLRGNIRAVVASPYAILNINGFIEVTANDIITLYARNQTASRGQLGAGGPTKLDIKYIK